MPKLTIYNGKTIVYAALWKDKVILWDVGSGESLGQLEGGRSEAGSLALRPDGKTLALDSLWSDKIELSDVASGKHDSRRTGETPVSPVTSVAFSLDGKFLVSGCEDRNLWL